MNVRIVRTKDHKDEMTPQCIGDSHYVELTTDLGCFCITDKGDGMLKIFSGDPLAVAMISNNAFGLVSLRKVKAVKENT